MAVRVGLTLKELRSLVEPIINRTMVASDAEVRNAINYGLGKINRAIRSVRPQHFLTFVEDFTLSPATSEYDVSAVSPPISHIVKLISPGNPAGTTSQRVVLFHNSDMRSVSFEELESSGTFFYGSIVYDLVAGLIPRSTTTVTTASDYDSVSVVSVDDFSLGSRIRIADVGSPHSFDAEGTEPDYTVPTEYFGTVVGINGLSLTVAPRMSALPGTGAVVTPYWSRMLKIAPTVNETLTGRLWYQYNEPRLVKDTDVVSEMGSEHRDIIVAFAVSFLLRSVDESSHTDWLNDAQMMISELMQDADSNVSQQSEGLETAFAGTYDY